ncbi:DUF4232 domain-containing protein [Streptomyces sp. NBC_00091]|uniref:DUF4232 domain-containing protein n=1 Tax=Streptomyces sp. NBC_00091 TaxID=2975648 RepID=UPI0022513C14|nr:DUF4232 domain-containing protein [Streptomyces sp. NBC_00091]MCX5378714.1 DUF4232 domain-containing protein [Streptomyces sp. NBC_00091]
MRAARNRWKTYALGAAAIAALLSSTACESGGTDDGKSPTPSATPSATTTPTTTPVPTPTSTQPGGGGATGASKSPGGGGKTTAEACNDNDLSIATSFWRQDSGQHLLITATNMSDKPCTLYHYPYVRFGADAGEPVAAMGSEPKAIATIGPKEKGYAGVFLFRGGQETFTVTSFALGYQDRALNSNRDVASLDISLSGEVDSLNVGPNPRVSYWNTDLRAIEDLMFRS